MKPPSKPVKRPPHPKRATTLTFGYDEPNPKIRPSKVQAYNVSADAPVRPLPPTKPRRAPDSLTRDPTVSTVRIPSKADKKVLPRAVPTRPGNDLITRLTMDEAERLERVTIATEAFEQTVKKRSDYDLVTDIVAATECCLRAEGPFIPLFERQKDLTRNELLWRLKLADAVTRGHPPPVRVTKERPVYGKDVDARPAKAVAQKPKASAPKAKPHKALPPIKPKKR